jgi:hypothetical protein
VKFGCSAVCEGALDLGLGWGGWEEEGWEGAGVVPRPGRNCETEAERDWDSERSVYGLPGGGDTGVGVGEAERERCSGWLAVHLHNT